LFLFGAYPKVLEQGESVLAGVAGRAFRAPRRVPSLLFSNGATACTPGGLSTTSSLL